MSIVSKDQLQPCDVLLYQGKGVISRLIMLFDGGRFSHASIYEGEGNVVEAIGGGITSRELAESIGEAPVEVYRFIGDTGQKVGPGGLPAGPILARVAFYKGNPERYAYEQILLLAALVATRRLPVAGWAPGLGLILRTFLDSAAERLSNLIAIGREPLICSELVFRCFDEAGPDYKVKIHGADILKAASLAAVQWPAQPLAFQPVGTAIDAQALREQQDLQIAAAGFLDKYAAAKNVNNPPGTVAPLAAPDFVTPRDLESSPNLFCAGRLQL